MVLKRNTQAGKNNFKLIYLVFFFYFCLVFNSNSNSDLEGAFTNIKILDKISSKNTLIKLENGKINDEALKLICKCSEGSVRDSLSLLDRALLIDDNTELNLETAQKIFGHFDKSLLIKLLENIFNGNEKEVVNIYQSIYTAGVDPSTFLNDFLEILY